MKVKSLTAAVSVVLALALAPAIGPAAPADSPTLEELAAAIDRTAGEPDGFRVVVGHISRTLGIAVEKLRLQQTQTGLGWGELLIANHLARRANVPLDQIAAEVRSGKSWTDIGMAHTVDLASVIRDVESSADVVRQREEDLSSPRIETAPRSDTPRPAAPAPHKRY